MIEKIENEQDYDKALKRLDEIIDAKQDTAEFTELDALAALMDGYEDDHHPMKERWKEFTLHATVKLRTDQPVKIAESKLKKIWNSYAFKFMQEVQMKIKNGDL